MNQKKSKFSSEQFLFYAFLALFLWLPLPLGSNRSWAVAVMEIWILSLTVFWLFLFYKEKVRFGSAFRAALIPLLLFALFLFWVLFQSIPLPASIVRMLSPETFHVYQSAYQELGLIPADTPLSIPISLNAYGTYEKFLETLSYFLLFCLMLVLLRNTRRIRWFTGVIIVSGVFQAVYGSVISLSSIQNSVATGTFVNRNHLAGYLEMSLAIGIGLLISTLYETSSVTWREFFRRLINSMLSSKIRLRIALALMVIALVLTHSRMGNTAFFSSLTGMGLVYLLIVRKPPRSAVVLFVSLLAVDMFIVGAWFGIDKVAQRIENTSISKETRDEVVRDTITMIKDYPLTGTGGGTYDISFLRYRGHDIYGFYDHAHNDYMEFMAEYGAIGMSFLALLVLSCLARGLYALRKRKHPLLKGMAFAASMGIVSLLIHSSVDFNLQIPANAALFVSLLALAQISLHLKVRSSS